MCTRLVSGIIDNNSDRVRSKSNDWRTNL